MAAAAQNMAEVVRQVEGHGSCIQRLEEGRLVPESLVDSQSFASGAQSAAHFVAGHKLEVLQISV